MSRWTKIAIGLIAAAALGIVWFFGRVAYRQAPHAPLGTPLPSPPPAVSDLPAPSSLPVPGVRAETFAVPKVTLQEFRASHVVSAQPAHKSVVSLRETGEVAIRFDAQLEAPSRVVVLTGKKLAASSAEIGGDAKTLRAPLATGAFDLAVLPRGVYEVYYTACFRGEGCTNGQYAFVGI